MQGCDPIAIYNNLMANHDRYSNANLWFDNAALYRICEEQLGISNPSFVEINKLIAEQVSILTYSRRFGGTTNKSLKDIFQNLTPYPRICNFSVSRPFMTAEKFASKSLA